MPEGPDGLRRVAFVSALGAVGLALGMARAVLGIGATVADLRKIP
jgi:hypothetical protein